MRSGDESRNHLVVDIMAVNLDMLCVIIKGGVSNDKDGCLVVTMQVP